MIFSIMDSIGCNLLVSGQTHVLILSLLTPVYTLYGQALPQRNMKLTYF